MGTLTGLLAHLDSDQLRRGKQFEKIVKWWLQNDPARSRNIKTVWLWDEWADRPGRDIGVDLVAELLDGTLCAIQAKCYDAERDIPKSEIDSFISAASPRTFAQRWLVATTNGLSANARLTIHDNHVTFVPLAELDAATITWPTHPDALRAVKKPGKAKPRPHQQRAIRDVLSGLETNSRGQLIMACGTGKTLTALWITERLDTNTTLVLVPSLNLLSQTLTEWAHNTRRDWTYICVCSDDTVNKEDDQPINTTVDLPYPVTTKPSEIAHFLKSKGRKIVFSTYQSSAQVAKAQKLSGKKFDLTICDEAHRLTGKTEADYATVLDEKKIISKKRLFMTATPRTYTANVKAKAEERGVEITSMDDTDVYGPQFHRLTFGEAIKQELLTDYQVVIVGVTDPQVQDLIDRRELVSVNDTVTTDARTLAAHIGLAKATKDFNLARTISFHSRIKTAAQFAEDHPKILDWLPETHKPKGTTWTDTISGDMNTGHRRTLLQQLRKEQPERHALLTNARCLTEGVDVPTLDGVAFIDPRSSQVDIIQAVGRAIRRSTNKSVGTIVLPVLIPESTNAEAALSDSSFKPIWSILNALRSHDLQLAVELDQLRTELGRSKSLVNIPKKVVFDFPADIDQMIPRFTSTIVLTTLERTTSSWEWWFGLLTRYLRENNGIFPIERTTFQGSNLGVWTNSQRQKYRNNSLPQDYVVRLQSLEGWTWSAIADQWNKHVELYREYAIEHGNGLVPVSYVVDHLPLGSWVASRRTEHKSGLMSQDRVDELERLPHWVWDANEFRWEQNHEALLQFIESFGHARPPAGKRYKGVSLGSWVSAQRKLYRNRKLPDHQIRRLEALPDWTWDPTSDAWESGLSALSNFTAKHHRLPTQGEAHFKSRGISKRDLARWVFRQRETKDRLSLSQRKKLESLPSWTWSHADQEWDQKFAELIKFANKHGHMRVPSGVKNGHNSLYIWIQRQRELHRKGQLPEDRLNQLNALPRRTKNKTQWLWAHKEDEWETGLAALQSFCRRTGHCHVPFNHVENGFPLSKWIYAKRNLYRSKKTSKSLSKSRIRELESLPGWSWSPLDDVWQNYFNELREHLRVTKQSHSFSDKRLRAWAATQRSRYKLGELPPHRTTSLETLRYWTWEDAPDPWSEALRLLSEFVKKNGRLPRQSEKLEGFSLGSWCVKQRTDYNRGKLPNNKKRQLESVEGWVWDPKQVKWQQGLAALKEFERKHATCRIPTGYTINGLRLDTWVQVQRTRFREKWISIPERRALERIPSWSWDPFAAEWRPGVAAAKRFAAREGHTNFGRQHRESDFLLGPWARRIRIAYFQGELSPAQVRELEKIPGWRWHRSSSRTKSVPKGRRNQ